MFRKLKVLPQKLLLTLVVCGTIFLFFGNLFAWAENPDVVYGYCKSKLNIREEMDVESKWLGQYANDSTIILLEDMGEWYKVEGGYVKKEYVFEFIDIDKVGIILQSTDIYGEASMDSGIIGYVSQDEFCNFIQKKNGFVELSTGGWVLESVVELDYRPIYNYPATELTLDELKAWNMPNIPIKYIGTLLKRSKAQGVTKGGGLYFQDSIPVYGIIDEYAYFPSGRHIYKMNVDKFLSFEEIGPTHETIAAYRTVYYSSSRGRKHNIELVSSILDGTVIESGETFSYNKTTGPRSERNGYEIATVIQNGEYVDDFGGGVCQVSSTIYAAIMNNPNLDVISRKPHGLEVTYLPYGMDATVSYGSIDLRFVNNYPFSIKLNVYAMDGVCMVTLTKYEQ